MGRGGRPRPTSQWGIVMWKKSTALFSVLFATTVLFLAAKLISGEDICSQESFEDNYKNNIVRELERREKNVLGVDVFDRRVNFIEVQNFDRIRGEGAVVRMLIHNNCDENVEVLARVNECGRVNHMSSWDYKCGRG